ncbi:MAG TPA: translation elongation factor Ts, partial [Rubellimicrobium sp.]|nr:translation elongation factor Ts [Rubellimicrobium sp.]
MTVTASMVKELRESTGAGMMDAKKALTETDGNMEAAVDWLRTKGLAKAAKKSGRTAAEGLVGVAVEGGRGVVVEVNSETDFVAKNAEFQGLVRDVARAALKADDVEGLKSTDLGGKTAETAVSEAIAKIGENMAIRRMAALNGETVVSYVHNAAGEGLGKIGVLVALSGTDNGIGRQIAMHVAAAGPAALDEAALDPVLVAKERQVQFDIAKESGKPDAVIEKMLEGRMKKFMAESTLMGQAFVVNPDLTVAQAAKDAGVTVTGFVRLGV